MTDTRTTPFHASLSVGTVALTVHDAVQVADFYQRVIGLHRMGADGGPVCLGTGDRVLLELRPDLAARRAFPGEAGLFHTAFLLPGRAALAAWLRHAAVTSQRLHGASDHAVSEALYLADPEGNGIEIYADRPEGTWRWSGGTVHMPSEPLDLNDLLAQDDGRRWEGLADATVGHVHLQVGDIPEAERFYAGTLGLDVTARYSGGTFYSAAGYHHHLATNTWNSRGALPREGAATGLAEVTLELPAPAVQAAAAMPGAVPHGRRGVMLRDPWNTALALVPKEDAHHS